MPDRNLEKSPKNPGKQPKVIISRWAGMKKLISVIATTITAVFARVGKNKL